MPSTTDRSGLPSIATPDSQRVRSETSRQTSKDLRGRSNAHMDVSRSSQTLTPIRTSVRGKQGNREGGNVKQQQSVHHRTSRTLSVSVGDTNWNSEGGRPKRERSPSERSCERLLRRSLNSVGELIPFQRAPRDGSYESQLLLGRRVHVGARRPAKSDLGDVYRESLSCEQRRAARLQERPADESCEERVSKLVTDSPTDKDKRLHAASKSTFRRNKISVPRKENTREGNSKLTEVPTWSKSKEPWKSDPSKALALSKRNAVHTVDVCATTDVCPRTLRQDEGKNTHASQSVLEHKSKENSPSPSLLERSNTADIQTENFSPRSSNESLICPLFAEEENLTFSRRTSVASPSAEFRAAAQLQSSTSAESYSTPNANTPSSTSSNTTRNQATESNESNTARQEQHHRSAGQPNSVIRRLNSSGSINTSQIQLSRAPSAQKGHRQSEIRSQNLSHDAPTSSEISPVEQDCAPSDTDYSAAGSSSQTIASSTDDPNLEKDPTHPSTNTNLQALDTSTPQVRLNRFGRRIRLPSTDSVLRPEEHEQVGQDDVLAFEPVGEERSRETNDQRYGFSAVSRNNRIQTDQETPSLTPNRDLLYGRYSPPALRRHRRAHFGGIHVPSDHGHSSDENRSSAGDSVNHNSTFDDTELNLAPDSFRNASGSAVVFSPVLQSGPDSSSSLRASPRRRLPIETNSPRELPSPISDFDESFDNDLDHETLTFSVDEGHVSRDFMRRHQTDRSEAISRLLPQRSRRPSRRLSREVEIMEEVFESTQDQSSNQRDPLEAATMELQVPLLGSPLFAPLGVSPAMLLGLLIRTRREFGQEFMELLLENMMLNALAHHLFEGSSQDENGLSGAPPPANQDIIDNLKEIPALETHIAQEMKCAICHSEYELYETLAELPCLHFFHPTCVANWLKKSGTCPVCRFHLSSPTR